MKKKSNDIPCIPDSTSMIEADLFHNIKRSKAFNIEELSLMFLPFWEVLCDKNSSLVICKVAYYITG